MYNLAKVHKNKEVSYFFQKICTLHQNQEDLPPVSFHFCHVHPHKTPFLISYKQKDDVNRFWAVVQSFETTTGQLMTAFLRSVDIGAEAKGTVTCDFAQLLWLGIDHAQK